jgi:hypothetical protein
MLELKVRGQNPASLIRIAQSYKGWGILGRSTIGHIVAATGIK